MARMSSSAPGPRPSQVTIGGWVVAVASAMLVVGVFDTMGDLYSVDTRDDLTRALSTGSAKDLGLSVDDALVATRIALLVAGGAAAMTTILGGFVLRRHAASRVALTVAAVPVVLTSPFSGGILGLLVGSATALLWTRPARDWFAGRAPAAAAATRVPRPPVEQPPALHVGPQQVRPTSAPSPAPPPPPTPGWGEAPTSYPPPVPGSAYAGAAPPGPAERMPAQVRVACILTWVFAALTGAGYLVLALVVLVDRDATLDLIRDNASLRDASLSDDTLVAAMVAVSLMIATWCLSAVVFAWFTWRRRRWAWLVLTVGVGLAALACVLAIPFSLVHLAALGVTFRLLLHGRTRAWFAPAPPIDRGWPPPDPAQQQPPAR